MRMNKLKLIYLLIIISSLVRAESDPLIGVWNIEVQPDSEEQFQWWQEIKYPKKLIITKDENQYSMVFTSQYDYECKGTPMSVNQGLELVFEFCSGIGTKHSTSWSPIHHAKVINGKLYGVVTDKRYLFKWIGTKVN